MRIFLCEIRLSLVQQFLIMKNENISLKNSQSLQGFTFLNSRIQMQPSTIFSKNQSVFFIQPPHDDQPIVISSNSSNIVQNLPGKVYENCQRTARVIMLSELQKVVSKDKKLKHLLTKILSQFMPNKNQTQSGSQYSNKKGYYQSLHYSRVRIGQRQFLKNILLNSQFKEIFDKLFKKKAFESSEKARKNQRSQISFEKRRQIISNIIQQYKQKFEVHFKIEKDQTKQVVDRQNNIVLNQKQIQTEQKQMWLKEQQLETVTQIDEKLLIPLMIFPVVPIPLLPNEYQNWQKNRLQSH